MAVVSDGYIVEIRQPRRTSVSSAAGTRMGVIFCGASAAWA
jgi:hypothetical protein